MVESDGQGTWHWFREHLSHTSRGSSLLSPPSSHRQGRMLHRPLLKASRTRAWPRSIRVYIDEASGACWSGSSAFQCAALPQLQSDLCSSCCSAHHDVLLTLLHILCQALLLLQQHPYPPPQALHALLSRPALLLFLAINAHSCCCHADANSEERVDGPTSMVRLLHLEDNVQVLRWRYLEIK